MAGVRGRRSREAAVERARGMVCWREGSRHGVEPGRVLGDMVRVIAYERRR